MTPLGDIIREIILAEGPMPVDRYMALCLGHPQHGYYMTRDPFGARGDFTTAPEISQVFGELIGVWCAQVWQMMGAPPRFSMVELGPGRGTLMKDALRATRKVPGFLDAAQVHFVETSPVLRRAQTEAVGNAIWHDSIATLPRQPLIVIANEFFDALPVKQYEEKDGVVRERVIGVEGENPASLPPPGASCHPPGRGGGIEIVVGLSEATGIDSFGRDGVFEISPARLEVAVSLGQMIAGHGGAAIVIDHGFCSILDSPGEADITSHVDFEQLGVGFRHGKGEVLRVMTQGEFLNAMGVHQRAEALGRSLTAADRQVFLAGIKRLADDTEMGHLFKVMAVTGAGLSAPYPFEAA
jgi:NADH dehydrogenase [ubiquinone] 1 alpha subcomplex assembly factor 7